ncbi:hypothetical protein Kisp01_43230 [Kineosporia sp. NBRC 101677]|nr:hypothetical protein Kisp01_43230 [Kineosporia sp. NBRC 101677]
MRPTRTSERLGNQPIIRMRVRIDRPPSRFRAPLAFGAIETAFLPEPRGLWGRGHSRRAGGTGRADHGHEQGLGPESGNRCMPINELPSVHPCSHSVRQ